MAVAAVSVVTPAYDPRFAVASIWLCSIAVLAHILNYSLPDGKASASIATIPFAAAALLSPNYVTIAGVALTIAVTEAFKGRAPLKLLFNVSQWTLAITLGIAAYTSLGGSSLLASLQLSFLGSTSRNFGPFAVLLATFSLVNTLAVSVAIAIAEQRPLLQVWRKTSLSSLGYDVLTAPIAYLMAWLYVRYGPVASVLVSVPLLGFRQLYITNFQLERVNEELLQLMVKAIEARDPYTSGHSRRVSHFSKIIARAIGLGAKEVDRIGVAALLHDVGKIYEEYAPLLRKPDKLSADEWVVMKTHPIKSAELVSTVSHLRDLIAPLRHHHENWDGSGYPDGIAANSIPLAARVIIFADTTDAMTTDRPYRKALGLAEVRAEFIRCRGKQFDPTICDRLLASPLFELLFVPIVLEEDSNEPQSLDRVRRLAIARPA